MSNRSVVIGVTGGIAAFKTARLVSDLVQAGLHVDVVMTRTAQEFVGPATFRALTGQSVVSDMFDPRFPLGPHIELARGRGVLCVAPASANFLGQAAHGIADDLLTTLYLAFSGPVIMAPAMNAAMWKHSAVARNVAQLRQDGVHFAEPESGWLSCRDEGIGRMAEPDRLATRIHEVLAGER